MRRPILVVVVVLLVCSVAMPVAGQDESTPLSRLRALKAERLGALPKAAAAAIAAKTVVVDCARRETLAAAMAKNAGPLVIELRGTCRENVRIERNDLTLRGADPAADGIQGVTAEPAVDLHHANRVLLEKLFVADSPGIGVGAWFSEVEMRNCRIAGNGGSGIHASASSSLTGTELEVSPNGGRGILSYRGAFVSCTGCRLDGGDHFAAVSLDGGFMTLWNTVVAGQRGISALGPGSYIDVDCFNVVSVHDCSVDVTGPAARAVSGGDAALIDVGEFRGPVSAYSGGEVGVLGGEQTLPAGLFNEISDSAQLSTGAWEAGAPGTVLANTHLSRFARAFLRDATVLSGTLTCESGADAWSDTPQPAARVVNCPNVPTLPP
jgi:hypothetical protein